LGIVDRTALARLFQERGYTHYKWIEPGEIVVAQWVRMKCTFGCGDYGRNASCPPNTPSVDECWRFLQEYNAVALFHFAKAAARPEDRHKWSAEVNKGLLALERAVFLAGYRKAFLLFMDSCHLCGDCTGVRATCNRPALSRPSPEGMAIDVFTTVRKYGYPIEVLTDYDQTMNRYAFLLID
jgi:predicted metal-binding protein